MFLLCRLLLREQDRSTLNVGTPTLWNFDCERECTQRLPVGLCRTIREYADTVEGCTREVVEYGHNYSGGLNTGKCLAAKTVVSTSPTNGTTVDGTAATTAGGFAAMFVTANTRNGAVTVKVQHSVDGTTWVDKATFTAVSATQLASQVIPLTGTINRYTRVVVTLAGSTGSATVTVALSRG